MILDIICAGVITVVAGTVGYAAASTVLTYASEGPTPRVSDKFVNLCTSFALVAVLVAANLAAGDLFETANETVTAIADVLAIVAMSAVLAFDICSTHLVSTYRLHRLEAIFDPDIPAITPSTWLRVVLYISGVVSFAAIAMAVLL